MTTNSTDYTASQIFTRGDRVELHPGCDLWMRGAKYGTVRGTLPGGAILVRMDSRRVRGLVNVTADRLRPVRQEVPTRATLLDCGHPPSPHAPHSGPTGVARDESGRTMCYACADTYARDLLRSEKKIGAYLSSDGATLTTWTGGHLMTVTRTKTARVGFRDVTGRPPVRYFLQATDIHGQIWLGTSPGPGMFARMRRH